MWSANMAFNGLIACGVVTDMATHRIGHVLTGLYGIDHARTLAMILPYVWRLRFDAKKRKLSQMGRRVWGLNGSETEVAETAIRKTEEFFHSLGVSTAARDYEVPEDVPDIVAREIAAQGGGIGEHRDIGPDEVAEILTMSLSAREGAR
jgi:NADP-dependent alcohol dehydrogenase